MMVEVEGERFDIKMRLGPDGQRFYDFSWINGPSEQTYGFTIGTNTPMTHEFSPADLEEKARGFVAGFFSPGGIGETEFPKFVTTRRGRRE